jgi:HD-GYP domain-containing protein (c-di-GMP phosphodiesterase class II)
VTGPSIRLRGVSPAYKHLHWDSDVQLRVGRTPNLEIVLEDASVSRRHAEVVLAGEGWVLRDLGSTNGTRVNGIRVGRTGRRLQREDVLQFGDVLLCVAELNECTRGNPDTLFGACQVTATAEHSWEQAMDNLANASGLPGGSDESLLGGLLRGQHRLYQSTSVGDLLGRSLREVVDRLQADYGAVVLMDPLSGRAALAAAHAPKPRAESERPFSQTLAQRCLAKGESLLCKEEITLADGRPSAEQPRTTSILSALLRTSQKCLGIIHLERTTDREAFSPAELQLADAFAANLSAALENLQRIADKQRNAFVQTVLALAQAVELRDPYTGGHAQRVTDYALLLAEELKLSEAERQDLRLGAPLHDIGKIGIDDTILRKKGPLTQEEFLQMQTHTVKGVAILQPIPEMAPVLPLVRSHHERWDGNGYPDALGGEAIPYLARVLAVADTFDAMTTDRHYRAGLLLDRALLEIKAAAGTQFDADCAAAFLRLAPVLEERFRERCLVAATCTSNELRRTTEYLPELALASSPSRVCPLVRG